MTLRPQNAPQKYSQAEESRFRFDLARQIEAAIQLLGEGEEDEGDPVAVTGSILVEDSHGAATEITAEKIKLDPTFKADADPAETTRAIVAYGPAASSECGSLRQLYDGCQRRAVPGLRAIRGCRPNECFEPGQGYSVFSTVRNQRT